MHHARIGKSKRLQRTLRLLSDGQEHSTRDIIRGADVCAVNSIVSELRANGIRVRSRCSAGVWFYRLGDGVDRPHARNNGSLPPEGAQSPLGAAQRGDAP